MEFLEGVISERAPASGATPPARVVTRAWEELRSAQPAEKLCEILLVLEKCRQSLYLGEYQVRLILSAVRETGNACSPEMLGRARASAALVISVWVRKYGSKNPATLKLVAETYCELLQVPVVSDFYLCQAILLLGSVCATPGCPVAGLCQGSIIEELTIRRNKIVRSSCLADALAGIGYTMIGSTQTSLRSIVGALVVLWSPTTADYTDHARETDVKPRLQEALMVLRLFKFLGSWLSSLESSSVPGVHGLWTELARGTGYGDPPEVEVVKIMASAGLLRGLAIRGDAAELLTPVRENLQSLITSSATRLTQQLDELRETIEEDETPKEIMYLLRCLALGIAGCRDFGAHPSVLLCLARTLFQDVFDFSPFYTAMLQAAQDKKPVVQDSGLVVEERASFKEAGSLAGALCNQYKQVAVEYQRVVECMLWKVSLKVYERQRVFLSNISGERIQCDALANSEEAVFLSMVLFCSTALGSVEGPRRSNLAAYVLDSFSCVEYLRRFNIQQYAEAIKECVSLLSGDSEASSKFASFIPSSTDYGASEDYVWYSDATLTSRVNFYLRVLPSCVKKVDDVVFETKVAPVMFLFMCHPSKQVAESSHALFATFVSQREDEVTSEAGASLPEMLSVYYVERALKYYPDLVSFEGLVTGLRAIVSHLPPGSAATVHCVDSLVDKAAKLFAETKQHSKQDDEPAHKLQTLLVNLILLVDMQVLPHLLMMLAKLVVSLPSTAQKRRAVEEALALVQGCDDCIRKPTVVPWLQSLAFLTSGDATMNSRL